ncbi:hypothetical protein [Methanorbis furvi]
MEEMVNIMITELREKNIAFLKESVMIPEAGFARAPEAGFARAPEHQ